MAENDPKKIRPFGQSSDRRHLDSEEDPLVELARIVSEDSGFYGSRAERPRPQREENIDRNAYSADLESELLQELESSFSRSTSPRVAPAAPRREPQPVAPPLDDSDDLLRSIERQLGEFERRTQATRSPSPVAAPPAQPAWENYDEQGEAEEYQPDQAEHVDTTRRADLADRRAAEARERISSIRPPEPQRERLVDRNHDSSASIPPTRTDPRIGRLFAGSRERQAEEQDAPPSRLPLRRRDLPLASDDDRGLAPLGGLAAGAASGWDRIGNDDDGDAVPPRGDREWRGGQAETPTDMRPTFGAFDDARNAGYTARDEPVRREVVHDRTAYVEDVQQPGYADPTFGEDWQDRDTARQDGTEDDPRVAVASTRGLDERRDVPERRRSRAGLVAAAVVLGVLVVGGAGAMYMRTGGETPSGPPPVIAAAEGDVKVAPEAQAPAEAETVGDAVYNRVAGNAPVAEEQVVDGAEEPREISRIVLPSPQEEPDQALVKPVGEAEEAAEPAASGEAAADVAPTDANVGPRRVRTYVVRPDGTIAETTAAGPTGAPATPPAAEQQVAAAPNPDVEPMVPVRVPTTEINRARQPQPAEADAAAQAAPQSPPPQVAAVEPAAVPAAPEPAPAASPAEEPEPPEAAAAEAEPEPAPAAAPPATTTAAASAPEPAPPAAAAAADGYVVQISSQRSMADAQSSWASAQRRYSSVLGKMEPNIQQADLGAKGTYYRVRVGPWASRGEAVQVCERLRAAGGDCIVTR